MGDYKWAAVRIAELEADVAHYKRERAKAKAEVERLRKERDELRRVVVQIVDRIVPLTPVVLAAMEIK